MRNIVHLRRKLNTHKKELFDLSEELGVDVSGLENVETCFDKQKEYIRNYMRAWKKENRDKVNASRRKSYAKKIFTPEQKAKEKERKHEYYVNNRAKILAKQKEYVVKNRDKINAYNCEWKRNKRARVKESTLQVTHSSDKNIDYL